MSGYYASRRIRPKSEQTDPYGDLLYQGTIWHCQECAGFGEPMFACDHPHKSRETALDCATNVLNSSPEFSTKERP